VDASDENNDLAYISDLRIGRYAAILLAVLVMTACVLATGLYYPTREDRLWALLSRKAVPQLAQPLDDSTVVSLYRTSLSCFGCSEYHIQIFGSGRVEYVGSQFVCAFGAQAGVADARAVRRLVDAMVGSEYFGFSWQRGSYAFDAPGALTTLRHQGRSYRTDHYLGDSGAPRWLSAMEQEIDRVAGSARWLPDPNTWQCTDPAGGKRLVTMREPPQDLRE
jgi:hypothetical protein